MLITYWFRYQEKLYQIPKSLYFSANTTQFFHLYIFCLDNENVHAALQNLLSSEEKQETENYSNDTVLC